VEEMLKSHHFFRANFIGHSLGTAFCAMMANNSKCVESLILLDPIVFLTFNSKLAYSFVYRHPGKNVSSRANEYLVHWLVSRELYISNYISRHFVWHQCIIWPDKLPQNHFIQIGLNDQLINSEAVMDYLSSNKLNVEKHSIDHAEFIINPKIQTQIIDAITTNIERS
jgi:pimeloyl-ACP methyl ester carboxylesterase